MPDGNTPTNEGRLTHNILHSDSISFTKCVFDQTGHSLDLGGSSNIHISSCVFLGNATGTDESGFAGSTEYPALYKEAIQIDYAKNVSGGVASDSSLLDSAPTHDVTVDGSLFLPIYTDSSVSSLYKYAPLPLGQHDSDNADDIIHSIQLTNSFMLDMKPVNYNGDGLDAPIHFTDSYDIQITNNTIERRQTKVSPAVFLFESVNIQQESSGVSSGVTEGNIHVDQNTIYNMNPQLVHTIFNAGASEVTKVAPAYAIFAKKTHDMDNLSFSSNTIHTYRSMTTPEKLMISVKPKRKLTLPRVLMCVGQVLEQPQLIMMVTRELVMRALGYLGMSHTMRVKHRILLV